MPTTFSIICSCPMRNAGVARMLWVMALALAVAALRPTPSPAQTCDDVSVYQQAASPQAGSIPLVIHIMERPGQPCEVRQHWTASQVGLVFGPSTSDQRGVNSIWGPEGITISIQSVEINPFTPPAGMLASVPPGPRGSNKFERQFRGVVARFHRAGNVNVYLWTQITGPAMGFGRSPRSGAGKATVWLDRVCVNPSLIAPEDCARAAAHELGHALGLYHSGLDGCAGVQKRYMRLCHRLAVPCGESANSERLMAVRIIGGRRLCPLEVQEVTQMAATLR